MKDSEIHKIIPILEEAILQWKEPIVGVVAKKHDPFRVLVATILSLRTKDETTSLASRKLFKSASTPETMLTIPLEELEKLIYPVGFYKNKAKTIHNICETLIENYNSIVPDEIDELLKFKGVGRKTANLVVTLGYNKPGICVDIHVHRISNRLGYINTKTPDESEFALRDKLPEEYWIRYNDLLVPYGQNQCKPISPFCSTCPIEEYCSKTGVSKTR